MALVLLAPFFGELVSGSTSDLLLLRPLAWPFLLFDIALYGAGALVIREWARRRALGWLNIWALGLAYGVFEEGLIVQSWFNPYWQAAVPFRGLIVFGGLAVSWAVVLTIYHATFSITVPIIAIETLFPDIAGQPWLGKQGLRRAKVVLAATFVVGAALFGGLMYSKQGYSHAPGTYLLAIACFALFLYLGLSKRRTKTLKGHSEPKQPWQLFVVALIFSMVFFVLGWGAPALFKNAPLLGLTIELMVVGLALYLARRQAASPGFDQRHLVAMAIAPLTMFVLIISLHAPYDIPAEVVAVWIAIKLVRASKRTVITAKR